MASYFKNVSLSAIVRTYSVRIQLNNRMMGVWLFLKDYIILREIGWGKDGGEIPKPWELYHKINKYCVTIQIEDSGKIPETAVKWKSQFLKNRQK